MVTKRRPPIGLERSIGAFLSLACAAALTACGSSSPAEQTAGAGQASPAHRVCERARRAAGTVIAGTVRMRIADSNPVNIECVIDGRGVRVDAVAQASSQAWIEFDTITVHQEQAYGSGAVHEPAQIPQPVPGMSGNVAWIPAQHELVATNGTEARGGSYVTVKVTRRRPSHAPGSLAVARAVARATLASAPRGPNPAAPSG